MSSNLSIRFIHPDANGRGREPLEEVLAHGTKKLALVCAFMTDAGYEIIKPYLPQIDKPGSFGVISIQQPTSYDALEDMFKTYPRNSYVHLGTIFDHYEVGNYIGLMHSKVFLGSDGNTTKVFCGSHNLTASALLGFNMEAATLVEGPCDDPFFRDVEAHLEDCRSKSSDFLPRRDYSNGAQLIIEVEVDEPEEFIKKMNRRTFIKFTPKGTKDQPKLTPGLKFSILLFRRGSLKPNKPAPYAPAYIQGLSTSLNLGPKSRLQGVDARFEDIRHTVTEMSSGQFSLLEGNVSKEDCMSAVLRPSSWGTNAGLYLMRKPLNEMEIAMAHGCVSSVESDQSYEEIERQPEPKIDADVAQFLRKRANVLDSLISRRRFWEAKWRRKNRG